MRTPLISRVHKRPQNLSGRGNQGRDVCLHQGFD